MKIIKLERKDVVVSLILSLDLLDYLVFSYRLSKEFEGSYRFLLGRSGNLTLEALENAVVAKFKSLRHVPVWKKERPESIRGGDELKVYRIYPAGMTQRQALYTFRFKGDAHFRSHVEANPCANFEVIFV